jgi:hypothetical protein
VDLQVVTFLATNRDPKAGERVSGHRVHVEPLTVGHLESAGEVPRERRA